MEKKISVIIPCFNATKWLPQCFLSLAKQTIGIDSLELIFVNDASTDDGKTWEMLTEFERAFPESIIIIDLPENRRQGGARNEGMKYASGEYIAFVDADDWVSENIYEKSYNKAKEYNADIVQFGFLNCFDNGITIPGKPVQKDEVLTVNTVKERKEMLVGEKLTYGCWNKLYRRSMVEAAGSCYAEYVIYEEPLFVYPLLYYVKTIVTMSDNLYMYRKNVQGTMYKDMKQYETIKQHAQVQLAVWNFMKKTPFFNDYYEEIKLYFLHTYFYETMYFLKLRDMEVPYELYWELYDNVKTEVKDYDNSEYEYLIPKQMKLYRLSAKGMTKEMLDKYISEI